MRGNPGENLIEERVTVLTPTERIDGTLFYRSGMRLSDFLNAPIQQESHYIKLKNPTVRCRISGETLDQVPFVMVARDRIVLVMTHEPEPVGEPEGMEARNSLVRGLSHRLL